MQASGEEPCKLRLRALNTHAPLRPGGLSLVCHEENSLNLCGEALCRFAQESVVVRPAAWFDFRHAPCTLIAIAMSLLSVAITPPSPHAPVAHA